MSMVCRQRGSKVVSLAYSMIHRLHLCGSSDWNISLQITCDCNAIFIETFKLSIARIAASAHEQLNASAEMSFVFV